MRYGYSQSEMERTGRATSKASVQQAPQTQGSNHSLLWSGAGAIQAKLAIGGAHDKYEQEADRVAATVMRMPNHASLQRSYDSCHSDERKVQRKSVISTISSMIQTKGLDGGVASDDVSQKIAASKGGGSHLAGPTKEFMEGRFGSDFSAVRVHTGANANQLSRQLNAQAFTVGNDVFFGAGKYSPDSSQGKSLLAHELTHTIQQGAYVGHTPTGIQRKPKASAPAPRPARPSDPSTQMASLLSSATNQGSPGGKCYHAVKNYIYQAKGYGDILNVFADERFANYQAGAVDFAAAVTANGAANLGLTAVSGNPTEAAAGTILVIKGNGKQQISTTYGDISVIGAKFGNSLVCYNDGKMILPGDAATWTSGRYAGTLMGMYQPIARPALK